MTDRELREHLAVLLGSRRRARELMARTSLRHLTDASASELQQFMPREVARRFHAAVRVARTALSPERPKVLDTPDSAWAHFYPYLAGRETERFVAIACDCRFHPLATTIISEGSPSSVQVRAADVFAPAIRHRAEVVVVAHCHPSGISLPSDEDVALTDRLLEAGRLLGVSVVDHLVLAGNEYRSVVYGDRSRSAEGPLPERCHTAY